MSYGDREVLVITRLVGPPKAYDGLPFFFLHREESVALLLVHFGHGFPCGVTVLMDKKTKKFQTAESSILA